MSPSEAALQYVKTMIFAIIFSVYNVIYEIAIVIVFGTIESLEQS